MISRFVIGAHNLVPAGEVDLPRERVRWTAVSRHVNDDGTRTRVQTYHEDAKWFGYPRHAAGGIDALARQSREVVDLRVDGDPTGMVATAVPDPEQAPVLEQFDRFISHGKTGFVLVADPGWGKTTTTIHMMAMIGMTTLVVVPTTPIVSQWVERLEQHSSLCRDEIGTILGRKVDVDRKKVVVGLCESLGLDHLGPEFFDRFGQVWFDEAHATVPPATFSPLPGKLRARFRGAMTATPNRSDGLDTVFDQHVGECWMYGKAGGRTMPLSVVVHVFKQSSGSPREEYGGQGKRGAIISKLARNPRRNALLAYYIDDLYRTGRRTVVISDRTSQLWTLRGMLEKVHGVSSDEIGWFCRDVDVPDSDKKLHITNAEIEQTKRDAGIILSTYGMMKMAVDIPDVAGLVKATPQSSTKQTDGRVVRFFPDKQFPITIDLWDSYYDEVTTWFERRRRHYEREGWRVVYVE